MRLWDLTPIYISLDSDMFINDMTLLKKTATEFIIFVYDMVADYEDEKDKLEKILLFKQHISFLGRNMLGYCRMVMSTDTQNSEAAKYYEIVQSILNEIVGAEAMAARWIANGKFEQCGKTSALIQEHLFVLNECKKNQKYQLSDREEIIVARMAQNGSDAWLRLKNQLIGSHTVVITLNGKKKELSLTQVLNMAYSNDREIRKKGYEAEIASYKKLENGIAACLNGIKGEVLCISEIRGYRSPLEMTLNNVRMDGETLNVMLQAIKEYLPAFRKYLRAKAKRLGYSEGLPFYELYAPVSDNAKRYSYEEACNIIKEQCFKFDWKFGNLVERAIEERWIDVDSYPGKVGGAFCSYIPSLKQSRILLNYTESFQAVVTMAHELGHAFHNDCLKDESFLNLNTPPQLAECASTFCEIIVKYAMMESMSDDEVVSILETEICDCTQVIVDIYSRFLFETALFETRKKGSVSSSELCSMMKNAQMESYGEGLHPDYLHPYMWTWKPHYYYADNNYYNFPYAFGLLLAKGLYALYKKESHDFIAKYKKMLASTGKTSVYDCCAEIGINIHDIRFWRETLESITMDIDRLVVLLERQ